MAGDDVRGLGRVQVSRRKRPRRPVTPAAELHTSRDVAIEIGRLGAMLIITILLQTTLAPHIRVLGASPDFALLAVVSVGLLRGSEIGALFGFVLGVAISIGVFAPLGLSSLVLVVVGYFSGRYAETADSTSGWTPVLAVLSGTAVAFLLATVMQFLLERQTPLGFVLTRVFLPSLLLNGLLAAPAYLLSRLWLREGVGPLGRSS
jgi:rod shape-determining protein MreD